MVSQKCQYALRALFELAKHPAGVPVRIEDVAQAQAIPPRFLEVILSQLKKAGFVESRRGSSGGYLLSRDASRISVGDIVRFIEGPVGPVSCVTGEEGPFCSVHQPCIFLPMWQRAHEALSEVYDGTTIRDLLEEQARMEREYVPAYAI